MAMKQVKMIVCVHPQMLERMDALAKDEFRTRAGLIREALHMYMDSKDQSKQARTAALRKRMTESGEVVEFKRA